MRFFHYLYALGLISNYIKLIICLDEICPYLYAATCSYLYGAIDDLKHDIQNLLIQDIKSPGSIDCSQLYDEGQRTSGIYRIWPLNWDIWGSFNVYCDMTTNDGGWTVIQRRSDSKLPYDYFFKNWKDYQMGFGDLKEDHWLGNDKIFALTNQGKYCLRINMKDKEGQERYAVYREFWIENESQYYTLHVSGYNGTAGDSLIYHDGMKFSTRDKDNDPRVGNCAEFYKGGWWYKSCHTSNLNGLYLNGEHTSYATGINWESWKGFHYSLPEVEMKIRRYC